MDAIPTAHELAARRSRPMEGGAPLAAARIEAMLASLPGWRHAGGRLEKTFAFAHYHETIAFVNALAWMVHAEDHHPELVVGYDRCTVRWDTHSVGGVSDNDFVCAAKSDALYAGRAGA